MASFKKAEFTGLRHPSPPLWMLAVVFTVLFCAGLLPVTSAGGTPYFPGPWESILTIDSFFRLRPGAALLCAFLQFGSAIPLGIFSATASSRMQFLGARAAGVHIALFGGFAATAAVASSSLVLWALAQPGIALDAGAAGALYYVAYALGGPGYSVTFGLLMAGVSIVCWFYRFLPRWVCLLGLILSAFGELSWLSLEFPSALFLVPLTRFPGFVWIIAAGFTMPSRAHATAMEAE